MLAPAPAGDRRLSVSCPPPPPFWSATDSENVSPKMGGQKWEAVRGERSAPPGRSGALWWTFGGTCAVDIILSVWGRNITLFRVVMMAQR